MNSFLTGAVLLFSLQATLLSPLGALAQAGMQPHTNESAAASAPESAVEWTTPNVSHVYGLPDAKPKDKGTLTLTASGLTFTGKKSSSVIARESIMAVSAGNQRVEIWGMKGRVLRAVIPEGGGLVAALFMHHRVDMLTVEFVDGHGGYHGAVFFLPAQQASHALERFATTPIVPREPQANLCANGTVRPRSVLLAMPTWDETAVPAAYRALVYERLYDRLRQVKGMDHVYRDGEAEARQGCPQYTMQLAISGFREGNQAKRAMLGPVGFFVGTTQMRFDASVKDASGVTVLQEQIKATTRGETESTNVAGDVAKKLTKKYVEMLKFKAPHGDAHK